MPEDKPPSDKEFFTLEGFESPKRAHSQQFYPWWRLLGSLLLGAVAIPIALFLAPFVLLVTIGEGLLSAFHRVPYE